MLGYSNRVNIEVVFLLTVSKHKAILNSKYCLKDLLCKSLKENRPSLSNYFVNDDVLNVIRILLSTTCHLTIR